jgi:sugar (pentulose or hexulose) kinase
MSFIGIDLGTSFIKGAVLNTKTRRPEHVERIPFPEPLPGRPARFWEYDPELVVAAARAMLDRLAPWVPDCEGILWSTQMHGLVLTSETGEAKSTLTTWLDERAGLPHPAGTGTYFDELISRITPHERRALGGLELRPGVPAGVLFWMVENGQVPEGGVVPASLADFVVARLTGKRPVTELTNAHAHGVLDVTSQAWHTSVIEKLGLTQFEWPEIKPQGEVVGHIVLSGRSVPTFTPIGDYQCALVGSQILESELSLNISTGSQVSLLRSRPEFGPFQTRPFFDDGYVITVVAIPAGRALNSLVKLLSELAVAQGLPLTDPWPYICAQANRCHDPEMEANVSFFMSAVGDHGKLTNLLESELTVGHLFRAAFKNMADNYSVCANRLSSERPWHRLVFSGGLVQKIELLRQFICDRFGVPYRYCPVPEDTMLGLLTLGLAFTEREPSVQRAMKTIGNSF